MASFPIKAEGKSKKQAARNLNIRLNECLALGFYKDGKTIYQASDNRIVALCLVHS